MTKRFQAHFENGVLVPEGNVELPSNRTLTVYVDEGESSAIPGAMPRFDDPADPMPRGGTELVEWWRRHSLPIDPAEGDRIARSKAYSFFGGSDNES
jgi:hypothetical protein